MKAKLFTTENASEIKLATGEIVKAKRGESHEDLQARAEAKFGDVLEVTVVDEKKLRNSATAQLKKRYEAIEAACVETEILYAILTSREIEVEPKEKPVVEVKSAKNTRTTMADAEKEIETYKHMVGSIVSFVRFNETLPEEGRVLSIGIDKRINKAYLYIRRASDNQCCYTRVSNKTIKVLIAK